MDHGNEPNATNDTHPYATPEGDLVVFAGDRTHRRAARLNKLSDGISVIAAGLVDDVHMHGTADAPLATFILLAGDGAAAYAAIDTGTYDENFGYLTHGAEISLHGIVRRPFEDGPPYIQVIQVEPITD